jgi:hypothetical protein
MISVVGYGDGHETSPSSKTLMLGGISHTVKDVAEYLMDQRRHVISWSLLLVVPSPNCGQFLPET